MTHPLHPAIAGFLALPLLLAPAAFAQVGGIAPRFLIDPASPGAARQAEPSPDGQSVVASGKDGVQVTVNPGPAGYPGVAIKPEKGDTWDLSPWGHVAARLTNTGTNRITIGIRVDNAGDWKESPWSAENVTLNPGETRAAKVIFGYSYNYQPSFRLNPAAVTQILFFLNGNSGAVRSYRIEDLQASGPAGEKPPGDPSTLRTRPEGGVIVGAGKPFDPVKQLASKGGAKAALAEDKDAIRIEFSTGLKAESAVIQPAAGSWDLREFLQVRVQVKNIGQWPAKPRFRLESRSGPTPVAAPETPIPPGGEAEITLPFAAAVPSVIPTDPRQEVFGPGSWNERNWSQRKGTGTDFHSGWVKGITILPEESDGPKRLLVTAVACSVPEPALPAWLGTKPPVDGEWVKTFDETFDKPLDFSTWNIYTDNYWDKRSHFSSNNALVRDGKLVLRYEKRTGWHNDNSNDTRTVGRTDYATGFADTYGKWVQRYGYFEARVKLPRAPGLWPAFWTMPDRGAAAGPQWARASSAKGGMEHDILEHLTGWGPYRYNVAFHWDGYNKEHKGAGSSTLYVAPDKDGFITAGLYWVPGLYIVYAQGREVLRWESPRVCSVESYLMFNLVSGGWDNVPLDDAKLPDEFVIDYVRAWQRKDLASPVDGPKPNMGLPSGMPIPMGSWTQRVDVVADAVKP